MIPAPTADNVDPVIRSGRNDFEQSAEPPEADDAADTPSRSGDVLAVALGMLIGLLAFLALLIAFFYEVSKAFGDQNAAGITETIVDLRSSCAGCTSNLAESSSTRVLIRSESTRS